MTLLRVGSLHSTIKAHPNIGKIMPTVLVPLANGCEELEAVTIIDLLRRASIDVTTASLVDEPIKASRGVTLIADTTLDNALEQDYDMIVLPGGLPGADHLNQDPRILKRIKDMATRGQYVGAICAAPKVLATAGLLDNIKATSYPGVLEPASLNNTEVTGSAIEIADNIITSRGPGTAMDFALTLIEMLTDKSTRDTVDKGLVRST